MREFHIACRERERVRTIIMKRLNGIFFFVTTARQWPDASVEKIEKKISSLFVRKAKEKVKWSNKKRATKIRQTNKQKKRGNRTERERKKIFRELKKYESEYEFFTVLAVNFCFVFVLFFWRQKPKKKFCSFFYLARNCTFDFFLFLSLFLVDCHKFWWWSLQFYVGECRMCWIGIFIIMSTVMVKKRKKMMMTKKIHCA